MRIQFIKARDTWPLRHRVLRPHQTLDDCDYPNDRNPDSFHLGAMEDQALIGIASFYREKNPALDDWIQWRLRGMAVEEMFRGNGVGTRMIAFAVDELRMKRGDVLWCQARETAREFYLNLGFSIQGQPFIIDGIGLHHIMFRNLLPVPQPPGKAH